MVGFRTLAFVAACVYIQLWTATNATRKADSPYQRNEDGISFSETDSSINYISRAMFGMVLSVLARPSNAMAFVPSNTPTRLVNGPNQNARVTQKAFVGFLEQQKYKSLEFWENRQDDLVYKFPIKDLNEFIMGENLNKSNTVNSAAATDIHTVIERAVYKVEDSNKSDEPDQSSDQIVDLEALNIWASGFDMNSKKYVGGEAYLIQCVRVDVEKMKEYLKNGERVDTTSLSEDIDEIINHFDTDLLHEFALCDWSNGKLTDPKPEALRVAITLISEALDLDISFEGKDQMIQSLLVKFKQFHTILTTNVANKRAELNRLALHTKTHDSLPADADAWK